MMLLGCVGENYFAQLFNMVDLVAGAWVVITALRRMKKIQSLLKVTTRSSVCSMSDGLLT